MTASFARDARDFSDYLSSLVTCTIAPNDPLVYKILPGGTRAHIELRGTVARVGDKGGIRIFQVIEPAAPGSDRTVTTLTYQYLYGLAPNPRIDWLVRYEYELLEYQNNPKYRYPIAHMHLNASSALYEACMGSQETMPLGDVHFPTRRITLEEFIELLIVALHVPTPGRSQQEALTILADSLEGFKARQTGTGVRERRRGE